MRVADREVLQIGLRFHWAPLTVVRSSVACRRGSKPYPRRHITNDTDDLLGRGAASRLLIIRNSSWITEPG